MGRSAVGGGHGFDAYRRPVRRIPWAAIGARTAASGGTMHRDCAPIQEEAPVIALTDNAASKVAELITAEGDDASPCASPCAPAAARASATRCSSTPTWPTTTVTEKAGVRVVVDPSSAQLLTGATLDYKDGLQQAGFSIDNPNAQRTCGCGSSFS